MEDALPQEVSQRWGKERGYPPPLSPTLPFTRTSSLGIPLLERRRGWGEKNGRSKSKELRDRLNCWLLYKSNSQLHVTQGIKSWEDATTAESPDTGSANARRRSYGHHAPNAMSSAIGEKTACRAKGLLPVKRPQPILALN